MARTGRPPLANPGYKARHLRVRVARGRAAGYLCEGCCGGQASDWALIHGKDGLNVLDYVPLCHPCHGRYDLADVPKTSEHRAKISAAMQGKTNALGNRHSPETRAKMSAARAAYWARKRGEGQDGNEALA